MINMTQDYPCDQDNNIIINNNYTNNNKVTQIPDYDSTKVQYKNTRVQEYKRTRVLYYHSTRDQE